MENLEIITFIWGFFHYLESEKGDKGDKKMKIRLYAEIGEEDLIARDHNGKVYPREKDFRGWGCEEVYSVVDPNKVGFRKPIEVKRHLISRTNPLPMGDWEPYPDSEEAQTAERLAKVESRG